MTERTPARGSVWTVPELGPDARALVLSGPRRLPSGQADVQVLPLTVERPLGGVHTVDDFRIGADELRSGQVHYAALWNARPVLIAALGKQVDELLSADSLSELRDAALRGADPHIGLAEGRVGRQEESEAVGDLRDREVHRWQTLTGKVFAERLTPASAYTCFVRLETHAGPLALWEQAKRRVAEALGKYGDRCDSVFASEMEVDRSDLTSAFMALQMSPQMHAENSVMWRASNYLPSVYLLTHQVHVLHSRPQVATSYRVVERSVAADTAEYPIVNSRVPTKHSLELA